MTKPKRVKKVRTLRPRDARTLEELCSLRRDNLSGARFWALLDGSGPYSISICQQRQGEPATQTIRIPRGEFNKIVGWYTRPQKVRK